jgi:hypothetical protein
MCFLVIYLPSCHSPPSMGQVDMKSLVDTVDAPMGDIIFSIMELEQINFPVLGTEVKD